MKLYRGDTAGALRLAEKAVQIEPKASSSKTILAIARARTGDIDGAIAAMEELCDDCGASATPYVYLAILRGYKRVLSGDTADSALISEDDLAETNTDLWPRQMADVFAGARSLESLASFDYSTYSPDWRRSIDIGRLVYGAAYDLSQGRSIDYAFLEQRMLEYRDLNFAHLAPILKDWADRVAAKKQ
jgi:hypothetical protein